MLTVTVYVYNTLMIATEFDYIIIGAGSAGAVLAHRLSADKQVSVCLLEAGGKDRHPLIHIPFGLAGLSRVTSLNWGHHTAPQPQLNQRELFWPRGKTLGGSSAINAMCYIRGQYSDYDDWAAAGASGWSAKEVLPVFRRSEHFCDAEDEFHGVGGPLHVERLRHIDPLSGAFVSSATEMGLPQLNDFNRQHREGLGLYHVTQKNGQRCSTAVGFLAHARYQENLTIITRCLAEKILLTDDVATGVQIQHNGQTVKLKARREVIVTGGAINTPQLLMLSGIGPEDELHRHGIAVKKHLPGVGQNLQDHLDVIIQHSASRAAGYGLAVGAIPGFVTQGVKYLAGRQGMLSSNIAEAGGFASSSLAGKDKPDLQFHFIPAILNDHGRRFSYGYGYGLHVCNLYPRSRGRIRLHSSRAESAPLIDPCYLTHPDDLQIMLDGVRLARRILQASPFDKWRGQERLPGEDKTSDDALTAFIRQYAETVYHPAGTCKMGAEDDPLTVVNSRLQVRGIENLRVADASVMPSLPGGNTNAPTIMIAEQAASFIQACHTSPA